MIDVALATCRVLPEPDPDEQVLLDALASAGLRAACLPWDAPGAPFDSARLTVLRSTWNYYRDLPAFLAWVDRVGPRLANPPTVVRWNAHKSYLLELNRAGIRTVPTVLLPRGSPARLQDLLHREQWDVAVVKPAVSAASFETRRVRSDRLDRDLRTWLDSLLVERDMLVQPYVDSVEGWGERAVVAIDGQLSHAVRKEPRFSGQNESVSEALAIEPDERRLAERALALGARVAGVAKLLYGRIDVARDASGRPMVMEFELIEPSLFLARKPDVIPRFVSAIAGLLQR